MRLLSLLFLPLIYARVSPSTLSPTTETPESANPLEQHHCLSAPFDKSSVYWNYGGSTVITNKFVRLTPASSDSKGWIWNEYPIESENFEVAVTIDIHSKPHFGGDGLVIWFLHSEMDPSYTKSPNPDYPPSASSGPTRPFHGPVFGMRRNFNGIGLCIDIYDNDNRRNNPAIFVIQNDGKLKNFGHETDYEDDMLKTKIDTNNGAYKCVADLRNSGQRKLLLKYLNSVLHVYIHDTTWKFCLAVKIDRSLLNHHLALTAATGQVADMHDLYDLTVKYLANTDTVRDAWDYVGDRNTSHRTLAAVFWLLVNITNSAIGGLAIYMLWNYHQLMKNRIDSIAICSNLNQWIPSLYFAQFGLAVAFLLTANFRAFLLNLPLFGFRIYEIVTKKHLFNSTTIAAAKGHSAGKVNVNLKLGVVIAFHALCAGYYIYRLAY